MGWKRHIGISFAIGLVAGLVAVVSFESPPVASANVERPPETDSLPLSMATAIRLKTALSTPPEPISSSPEVTLEPTRPKAGPPPPGAHEFQAAPPGRRKAPPGSPREAQLSQIRAEPLGWLGEWVWVDVQLDTLAEAPAVSLGRFTGSAWKALRAWPDEVFTWYPEVYRDPAPYLFVGLDSPQLGRLEGTRRFARLRLLCVVREIFLGEPWLEVKAVQDLEGFVNEGSILHVGRAIDLLREGSVAMAIDQLERARVAPLPAHAREELLRLEEAGHEVLRKAGLETE